MRSLHCIVCASAVCLACTSALAASVTITSNHDNTLFRINSANSGGGETFMFAGTDGNGANGDCRALVSFDIAGNIPANAMIQSVQLTMTLSQVAGGGTGHGDQITRELDLHRVTASWGEGTAGAGSTSGAGAAAGTGDATWTNRSFSATTPVAWTTPGGDYAAVVSGMALVNNPGNATTPFTWASTAAMVGDVQSWLNNPAQNFGWILVNADETDLRTFRAFFTREAVASLQPELTITWVPEPATLTMLGSALLMLGGMRLFLWRRAT